MLTKRIVHALAALVLLAVPMYTALAAPQPPIYLPIIEQTPQQPQPPAFPYAAAMRDGFKHEANQPDLAHYDLAVRVDPATKRLRGRVNLWFRNTTGAPLGDAVLRLYPNFPPDVFGDGGDTRMTVSDVVVQDRAVAPRYEAQNTAVRVPFPAPVAPGNVITLALNFDTNFSTFFPQDRSWQLTSSYPILAAWQGGWRTDVSQFPDRVYANSGLYHARITVPAGWTAISTGNTIGTTVNNDGTTTWEAVSGPVREFAFSVGRFASVQAEHEGVTLVVWYEQNSGLGGVAQPALDHLKRALTTFNQTFGPYPYRALETHLVLNTGSYNTGIEYPGLIYITSNGVYSTGTRWVLGHELAHQWYYGLLGNDIFNEAWLDEGFAQYSPYFVEAQWYGQAAADTFYRNQVKALADRTTLRAGLSVWEYGTWSRYYSAVYGRGAQFLHTLRGKIGDAAFLAGLQDLYAQRKYGVIGKADVLRVMEARSGQDLDAFFLEWLGR